MSKIESMNDEMEESNEILNSTSLENEERKIAEVRKVSA